MTDTHVPDSPVPIEGYRAWRVAPDGQLRSLTGAAIWSATKPTVAECSRGHRAPAFECTCGLYAMARVEDLIEHTRESMTRLVFGRIALWGTAVEHDRGWRAARGAVQELFASPWPLPGLAADVARLVRKDLTDAIDPRGVLFMGGPYAGVRPRPPSDVWIGAAEQLRVRPFPPTERLPDDDHDIDMEYWSNVETDLSTGPRFWCYRSAGSTFRPAAVVDHPSDWEVEERIASAGRGARPSGSSRGRGRRSRCHTSSTAERSGHRINSRP